MSAASSRSADTEEIARTFAMAASMVFSAAVGGATTSGTACPGAGAATGAVGPAGSWAGTRDGTARARTRLKRIRFLGMVGIAPVFLEEGGGDDPILSLVAKARKPGRRRDVPAGRDGTRDEAGDLAPWPSRRAINKEHGCDFVPGPQDGPRG